jgi:DNA-directed RNA polymerase III subunit RPC6
VSRDLFAFAWTKTDTQKSKRRHSSSESENSDSDSDTDSDEDSGSDSDALKDINDIETGNSSKPRKSKRSSSKKSKKRKRRSRSSDSSSDSSSDDSDDSDDNISIDSFDIDDAEIEAKPSASRASGLAMNQVHGSAFGITDLTNLTDEQVQYRATNKYRVSLATDQLPCGKCPRFHFCEQDGPVNPAECTYFEDWFLELAGGWDGEGKKRFKPDIIRQEEAAREEELRRRQGGVPVDEDGGHGEDEDVEKEELGDIEDMR